MPEGRRLEHGVVALETVDGICVQHLPPEGVDDVDLQRQQVPISALLMLLHVWVAMKSQLWKRKRFLLLPSATARSLGEQRVQHSKAHEAAHHAHEHGVEDAAVRLAVDAAHEGRHPPLPPPRQLVPLLMQEPCLRVRKLLRTAATAG